MNEFKNISEMMTAYANQKPADILVEKEISRYQLQPESQYAFCPYCALEARRTKGADWKNSIRPLWVSNIKMLIKSSVGEGIVTYENRWSCDNCHRKINEEDFVKVYSAPQKNISKFVDLSKVDITDPNFIANF